MGGLDCEIKMFDFASVSGILPLGKHAAPIRAVEYLSGTSHDMLVTGSWDQTGTYSTFIQLYYFTSQRNFVITKAMPQAALVFLPFQY
jgi:hypothetical protein